MWIISTWKDEKRREELARQEFERMMKDTRKKCEAREAFIKATTCPHCGRHDPLPPWLL